MKIKFKKEDIPEVSKKILNEIVKKSKSKARIVAMSGDLGAGKTTITKEIAKQLGVKNKVISPTFIIMKIYDISKKSEYYKYFKKLVHIDAYRLDSHEELLKIGWSEFEGDNDNLIIIEWPERVSKIIPKNSTKISLTHIDNDSRNLIF